MVRSHRGRSRQLPASVGAGEGTQSSGSALRLAGALWRFWATRGYVSEGRKHLAAALSRDDGTPDERWHALHGAGNLARSQGDYKDARASHEAALALATTMGDDGGIAPCLGDFDVAFEHDEQGALLALVHRVLACPELDVGGLADDARELAPRQGGEQWNAGKIRRRSTCQASPLQPWIVGSNARPDTP